jgi:hypothetical protein
MYYSGFDPFTSRRSTLPATFGTATTAGLVQFFKPENYFEGYAYFVPGRFVLSSANYFVL